GNGAEHVRVSARAGPVASCRGRMREAMRGRTRLRCRRLRAARGSRCGGRRLASAELGRGGAKTLADVASRTPDRRRHRAPLHAGERYFAGFGDPDTCMVLGWPEPPLRRMLVRHLGCEVLGDLLFLVRELAAGDPAAAPLPVTTDSRLPDDLDGLWRQCAAEWTSGLVRDRAYLEWRYLRHPRVRS